MSGELDFILRIFIASLLGGVIGLEREYRDKAAGFRTHFLVALGSALFMIISAYGFEVSVSLVQEPLFSRRMPSVDLPQLPAYGLLQP